MQKHAPWLVRLVGLWILAGGLAKLFAGTPADLPGPVRELAFGMEWNFRVAIGVEIAVGFGAQLMPRLFWAPVAALMVVFLGVLGLTVAEGAESCGCFGSDFPIPPWGMLAIDGALLVAMLASKPWKLEGSFGGVVVWAVVAIAGVAAPFWMFGVPGAAHSVDEGPWELPPKDQWPRWVDTTGHESWTGKRLSETPIGTWADTTEFPDDVQVILWRNSCDHCAQELAKLAQEPDPGPLALIRLNDDVGDPVVVKERPQVPAERNRTTPANLIWMFSTPVVVEVEGGVITSIEEHTE